MKWLNWIKRKLQPNTLESVCKKIVYGPGYNKWSLELSESLNEKIYRTKETVSITGCWLRVIDGYVQVLLEFDGQWHLINNEGLWDGASTKISHITEVGGIQDRPIDFLEDNGVYS